MEGAREESVLDRLMIASGSKTFVELADILKLSKQAVAKSKATGVPPSWIPRAATLFNVTTDWLFFGREPMRPSSTSSQLSQEETPQEERVRHPKSEGSTPAEPCPRCAVLEADLRTEREERREATATVLKLYQEKEGLLREKEALLRENADLKVQLARLESANSAPSPKRSEPSTLGVVLVDEPLQHAASGSHTRAREIEVKG